MLFIKYIEKINLQQLYDRIVDNSTGVIKNNFSEKNLKTDGHPFIEVKCSS